MQVGDARKEEGKEEGREEGRGEREGRETLEGSAALPQEARDGRDGDVWRGAREGQHVRGREGAGGKEEGRVQ